MQDLLDSLYDLSSSSSERDNAFREQEELSRTIIQDYELDAFEQKIVWIVGLLAGATDAFLVTDYRMLSQSNRIGFNDQVDLKHLSQSGMANKFVDNRIQNLFTNKQIRVLERANPVSYDASSHPEVVGMCPRTHRIQSFGHDPILGFVYGVKDIMKGTLTAIDNSGTVHVLTNGQPESFFIAVMKQFGHLASDISTPAGLPVPFMGQLMRIKGHSDVNGLSYQRLIKGMYSKGYNLNHFIGMGIPALLIEILVRGVSFIYELSKGIELEKAIPYNKPKIDKMLFQSYLVATGCNSVKVVACSGNLFSFNPVLYSLTLKYGISEVKRWWRNEQETARHAYVHAHYTKQREVIDHEIEQLIEFYQDKKK